MAIPGRRIHVFFSFCLAAVLAVDVHGQQPTVDLTGTWSIDTYLSDHGEQVAHAIEFDTGEFASETYKETAPRGRSGAPAANGQGHRGAGREGRPGGERLSETDRKLLAELTRPVQFPPLTLTISQSDQTLTTVGDRQPYQMRTDGKAEKLVLETGSVNRTAQWIGPQLRVVYEVGHAGLLTYTYSIVPSTGQLLVRINFERVRGEPGPFDIKVVYNRRKEP